MVKKIQQWVSDPAKIDSSKFPFIVLDSDPIQGTLIEIDIPDVKRYAWEDLKKDIDAIKAHLGI